MLQSKHGGTPKFFIPLSGRGFPSGSPSLDSDWLIELVWLSDGLSEGIHRGTMCPLRGSEVSLLTTAPPGKFVF